jgi:hypothetical protein
VKIECTCSFSYEQLPFLHLIGLRLKIEDGTDGNQKQDKQRGGVEP